MERSWLGKRRLRRPAEVKGWRYPDFCNGLEQAELMVLSGDLSETWITSARLTLRAFTAADTAESFAEANARIAKYMSWNPPASAREYQAIWRGQVSNMRQERSCL